MQKTLQLLCIITQITFSPLSVAWDSIGHRASTSIALYFSSEEKRAYLLEILTQHPRFEIDFLDAMPEFIKRSDEVSRREWLLGQAAYWPDIARGLPETERALYNRPAWHYTDGAWVRGDAAFQGNVYIDSPRFPDRPGELGSSIQNQADVHNVVTALDYNARVLKDTNSLPAERAVALCWLLHLTADIHQPLHAGSLFSRTLFAAGDRGGNGIPTDNNTLHLRWDRALADFGVSGSTSRPIEQLTRFSEPRISGVESDWTTWLNESREVLLSVVYSDEMKTAIIAADRSRQPLTPMTLDETYINQMQRIALQRIGLAGLRMAIWFENELD